MVRSQKIRIPLSERLHDFRRGPLQVLIWAGAAVTAFVLIERKQARFEFQGVVRALQAEISADVDGRIAELLVVPFDDVAAGETIARLDDALLLAEIETSLASIEELKQQIEIERMRVQADLDAQNERRLDRLRRERNEEARDYDTELRRYHSELRRYRIDEEEQRLARLAVEVQIEADLVERERRDLKVQRTRELVAAGDTAIEKLDDAELKRDQVDATIKENRKLVEALVEVYHAAVARRRDFEARKPLSIRETPIPAAPDTLPVFASVRAETLRVEEIRVRRRALTLTAPFAGRVSSVLAARGQALLAGEPVAMLTSPYADEILAYVPEEAIGAFRLGTRVLVSRRADTKLTAEATVTRLAPAVEELPARLWRSAAQPEYGRAVLCAGVRGLDLTPGESTLVRLVN